MAIAFDALSGGTHMGNNGTAGTLSHITTGQNRLLLVGVGHDDGNSGDHSGSVTYGGVQMTKLGTASYQNHKMQELWYLANPLSGANDIVAYPTASINGDWWIGGLSYTGVDQSTPMGGSVFDWSNSGTILEPFTTTFNNGWLAGFFTQDAGTPATPTAPTITRGTAPADQFGVTNYFGDNNSPITPAGPGTMQWTLPSSGNWSFGMAVIRPSPAGTNLIQSSGTAALGLGSTSVIWPVNTTTGNLIVVGVNLTNAVALGTVSSIVDSQSNTYVRAVRGTISSLGDILNAEIWYAANITGGAGSITVNHTIDNCAMYAREYSGFNTLDVINSANGSSNAPNTGTVTTNFATELLIVSTGDDKGVSQTWTPAGNYGDIVGTATTITGLSMEDTIVTSAAAQTGTLVLGLAANWDGLFASFYQAASGGKSTKNMMTLGVG